MPYGYTTPRYGMRDAQGGYRRPQRPVAPTNRGGMMGPAPFPSLAGSGAVRSGVPQGFPAPRAPAAPAARAPAAPAQAPRAPTQPVNTAPLAPTVAYDYSADPVLNQIQAIGVQDRGNAEANALRLKKQLAIDYGDVDLATQLGDTNTAQAAGSNPFSVMKQLQTSYEGGQKTLEDQLNKANLFYSGHRVNQLGELANQYQGQRAAATGQEQQALGGIGDQLSQALSGANARDVQAQQDAADRALQLALQYGIDPGAGGATGEAPPPPDLQAALAEISPLLEGTYYDQYGRAIRRGGR